MHLENSFESSYPSTYFAGTTLISTQRLERSEILEKGKPGRIAFKRRIRELSYIRRSPAPPFSENWRVVIFPQSLGLLIPAFNSKSRRNFLFLSKLFHLECSLILENQLLSQLISSCKKILLKVQPGNICLRARNKDLP